VAPFALLVPIFGTLFSFVVLNESLSFLEIVACSLVLIGLIFVVYGMRLFKYFKKLITKKLAFFEDNTLSKTPQVREKLGCVAKKTVHY
jgi:hypothetical protein